MAAPDLAQVFRDLQAGNAARALQDAERLVQSEPRNARARMAAGIALRMLGSLDRAQAVLEAAQSMAPEDHAIAYELGLALQRKGEGDRALERFDRSRQLRPGFFAAHYAAGMHRLRRGEWSQAAERFQAVVAAQPAFAEAHAMLVEALVGEQRIDAARAALDNALRGHALDASLAKLHARLTALEGDFPAAARRFAEAFARNPGDMDLPMFQAQIELGLGHWEEGWHSYRHREHRRRFEADAAARGNPYRTPGLDELRGKAVTLVGEQGIGDVLFFLRFAPRLVRAGAQLEFAGEERLHSLLARTPLFKSLRASTPAQEAGLEDRILVGDLPLVGDPTETPASLDIAPEGSRLAHWRLALEALGPRPWIAVTWRAGTPTNVLARGLFKSLPLDDLLATLRPQGGTVLALQRGLREGELANAARALGQTVHDFSAAAENLEDCLAVASLVDRHVAVSSTTMHLAAAAGATADVLVPFPPEWRWGIEGQSRWFPAFRVHRQSRDLDWSSALAGL